MIAVSSSQQMICTWWSGLPANANKSLDGSDLMDEAGCNSTESGWGWLSLAMATSLILVCLMALDVWRVSRTRKDYAGPKWVWPVVGSMLEIVREPFRFYEKQAKYGPISWNSIMGTETAYTLEVFRNSREDLKLWLSYGAKTVLGEKNITFLPPDEHERLRRQLAPVFQQKALDLYTPVQEGEIRAALKDWAQNQKNFFESRTLIRQLNVQTSLAVFVGPYATEEDTKNIAGWFQQINEGFVSFPLYLPGTALWRAEKARLQLTKLFTEYASWSQSRYLDYFFHADDAAIPTLPEPQCLLDVWVKETVGQMSDACTPAEMGLHLLDFLFAAQDATTSALVFIFFIFDKYPHLLAKVREEQDRVRPNDESFTQDILQRLTYTRSVVRELLRRYPPATGVPHQAVRDTRIGEHPVTKGSVVFPSIYEAHMDPSNFPRPEEFKPERFDGANLSESLNKFLAFGRFKHSCLGQKYAVNSITIFMSVLARNYRFVRLHTGEAGDKIVFRPTIFPADGCIVYITDR